MANRTASHSRDDAPLTNGHHAHPHHDTRPAPAPPSSAPAPAPAPATNKKGKAKKQPDLNETSNLLAARISQLELDAQGAKEQEAEVEREVRKATRELTSTTAKMSDMEKVDFLTKECSRLLAEMKRHERESQKQKKRADQLQKEKDKAVSDHSKTIGIKNKLEGLCRDLQKDSNKLKADNKTLADERARNRVSLDEKYSTVLTKLEEQQAAKDRPQQRVVDIDTEELFRSRFKSLIEQYELRELHFHSQMRTKELEVQYNLARFEREKKAAEAEAARSRRSDTQIQTFTKTETDLRQQLHVYVEKFKQVEDTLNNSNELFLTFRKEMEDMSRKTKRTEKENESLKRKHDSMSSNIAKMAQDRTKHLQEIQDLKHKESKLTNIINAMQQQGRSVVPSGTTSSAPGGGAREAADTTFVNGAGHLDGDESDYDEYDDEDEEDEEEGSEEVDGEEGYDDETEDELQHAQPQVQQPYGPERPPPAVTANGHA